MWVRGRSLRAARRVPAGAPAFLALGALAGAGLLAGCGADGADAMRERKPETVEVITVERDLLVDVAVFSGQIDAERSVMLRPEINGVIESIEFEQGQDVKEGDLLFRLRSGEEEARLREARANRDLARQRRDRAAQLVTRDATSLAARDAAQAEFEAAAARVQLAEVELERTRIRAPFDGVVGMRLVDVGARVEEESQLVQIDAIDRVQATFAISDEGLPFARPGLKVQVWVRPYPGEKFPGEVYFVSPTLDPRNRRILARAWIDNADHRLRPGLFANVDLEIRRVENAVVVPESAIAIDRKGPHVWKIDESNRAVRLPVEIGLRERGVVEVTQGLQPGTQIVSAGTHKVSEGKEVQIAENPLVGRARRPLPEGSLIGEGT